MKSRSHLTIVDYYLGVSAFFIEFALALTFLFSTDTVDRTFGFVTLLEALFALTGLLLIDVWYGNPLDLHPDRFKPISTNMLFPLMLNLGGLLIVQVIASFPLTVRTWQRAMAIWFSGPSEELFFRGLLLTPFMKWGQDDDQLIVKNPFSRGKTIISISLIEIIGLLFSSIGFTFLHFNYYNNTLLMIVVFFSGIVLGLVYQKYQDLTANILAHFGLNVLITIRTFGLLNF